jgi:hypothetical protein
VIDGCGGLLSSVVAMNELEVIALDEPHRVATHDELADMLRQRTDGGNHFMIAAADAPYPMLDLMIRGDYAVLDFFPRDGEAGSQAVSNLADAPGEVEFPDNSLGEAIPMPGAVLIDAGTAGRCVEQFAEMLSRPSLVDWLDL